MLSTIINPIKIAINVIRCFIYSYVTKLYKASEETSHQDQTSINNLTIKWPAKFSYKTSCKESLTNTYIRMCKPMASRSTVSLRASVPSQTIDPDEEPFNEEENSLIISFRITGTPVNDAGPIDELLYYKGYNLLSQADERALAELTQTSNVYMRRWNLYQIYNSMEALENIADNITKRNLSRTIFNETMIFIGMDRLTDKSYLTDRYPDLFIDAYSFISKFLKADNQPDYIFVSEEIDKLNWDRANRKIGQALANYHKQFGYTNKIILLDDRENAITYANQIRNIRAIFIGNIGSQDKGEMLNEANSKTATVRNLGRNLVVTNILRFLYSQIM